jgi:ABC-type thiamine transport system ATPase subunit
MVTHDPADAKKIASHTIVVNENTVHVPIDTKEALEPTKGPLADYLGNN